MFTREHLDKNNLHHAYLIEGVEEEILPEIFEFLKDLDVKTSANPDFYHIKTDSFKIEDARDLKSKNYEKSFSNGKKIFIISANNLLLEAQNALLKIFEEPIENTHFFVIIPSVDSLLKTLISRFYFISARQDLASEEQKKAEKFLKMNLKDRIDFIKELLAEEESEEGEDKLEKITSSRSKAVVFLNTLETVLHKDLLSKKHFDNSFNHIFKVREFLNQPGSSVKSLMESVALVAPNRAK